MAWWLRCAQHSVVAALVCLLAIAPATTNAKNVNGRGYFGTRKVNEITKFSFRPGIGSIKGNITYFDHPRGSIYLFMDTTWDDKYHDESDCDKLKHYHARIPIGQQGKIGQGIGVGVGMKSSVVRNNKYTWHFTWQITHAVRTYGWFVVIADCKGFTNGDELEEGEEFEPAAAGGAKNNKKRRKLRKNQFEYDLTLLNPDGDHLPADEHGLTTLNMIVFLCMLGYYFKSTGDYKKRSGNGLIFDSHAVVKGFAFAYIFQIVAIALELLHLLRYSSNGRGVFFFDFMSEFFEALSQLIISFTLICLANGWTLVDLSRAPSSGFLKQLLNRPTLDDETPTLFVLIVLVFVSTIFQLVSKLTGSDSFQQFHDHSGISGKFLIFQRILFGTTFLVSINGTLNAQEVRGKMQLGNFLRTLMMAGGFWFFAFPSLVAIASLFAHYLQHRVVTGGVLVIQSMCLTFMAQQLFSSSSLYSKISGVTSGGMLPGFGGKGKAF